MSQADLTCSCCIPPQHNAGEGDFDVTALGLWDQQPGVQALFRDNVWQHQLAHIIFQSMQPSCQKNTSKLGNCYEVLA